LAQISNIFLCYLDSVTLLFVFGAIKIQVPASITAKPSRQMQSFLLVLSSMRHYIVTITKFADECLKFLTYGATQSNWLANVDIGDIIFLSQFNYKSQNLFGPLRTSKKLFHAKNIIYPGQRYFYRIQFNPINSVKCIEETDLYINGIQSNNIPLYVE
jgi:hypothetical protein